MDDEEAELRTSAIQNVNAILAARRRAEEQLVAAQTALKASAEHLKLALAAGHLGDWSWNAASDVVTLAPKTAEIFGVPRTERMTWTAMRDLLHEDDRERARLAVERSLADRTDYDIEYRVMLQDGKLRWVSARGRGTYADDGTVLGMIGIVQDITQRKCTEEERRALLDSERSARAEAERLSAMKDEFLATLSHELRTPLGSILGWAQLLRQRTPAQAELTKGLETIERNARSQAQLIEDLLDMSRITSGKLRLDIQTVEPPTFVEAAIETVRPAADAKGIRLEKIIDPHAGPISGDPHRLQQVVWNLLSNAIKFTPKGGRVQVVVQRVASSVELSVTDTGIGIRPDFMPHVFERFRQADASTTRKHGGLGLGLAIVKHLIELHGGTVHASSEGEGRGTTFTVQLPLAPVRRAGSADGRVDPKVPKGQVGDYRADLSGTRILIVDDERDSRDLLVRVLSDCGAEVIAAGSAAEALPYIERDQLHLLVSDIGMPEIDGYELLRRARAIGGQKGARMPAIALTAFARSEDRMRALRAGFLVHVAKPVEPAEFVATVASVLDRTGGD